jgi:S-adenosylmethionine-diacylglycerol 3-amino-3-carboxypropyl transferase
MTGPSSALGERLLYSACWEDLSIARRALRISKDGLVVAIGSAGDNAIGLLLDDPRRVVAIDVNPAQTALIELKVAAVRTVPGTVAEFVGAVPGAVDRDLTRLDRYARLRPQLSPEAARYWDAHTDDIVAGVVHAGRFERYLAWFRRVLLPVVPGRDVVRAMLAAPDVEEQRRIYREGWDSPAWRALFRVFFSRRLLGALGRHPAFFDEASATRVGSHFLARAADGLTATPIRTNPYVTFILSGSYRLPDAAPEYLRPANATLLAERADRIDVRTCSLLDALRELPDHSVDAFYLSDIFELADPAGYEESLGEIARVGRPGARLCYWNNLVERTRPESLADRLSAETDLAARLHTEDRAFIYSRLVVEEVRGTSDVRLVGEVVHAA